MNGSDSGKDTLTHADFLRYTKINKNLSGFLIRFFDRIHSISGCWKQKGNQWLFVTVR
jgi:hypothetical protein